jgi:putative endonuclease
MEGYYYVYIATNQRHAVLYVGVTSSIFKREFQHREKVNKNSFTAKYNIDKVVFYEVHTSALSAIAREKQIKGGSRIKKIKLIESLNPGWINLVEESLK